MNLEPMWEKLAGFQFYAERLGFGEAWKRMTTERTIEAARCAADPAWLASDAAAWAASDAAEAARAAAEAAARTEQSIAHITRAIEQENKA